jgi:hypothetical protein
MRTSVLTSIGLVGLALASASAHATTYNVSTTNMTEQWGDGCSLVEATSAAYWKQANHECPAGTADNTINLGGGTYTTDWGFFTADNLTIIGSGMDATIIKARFLNNPQEQLFAVNGTLKLNQLTLEYTGPQNLFSSGVVAWDGSSILSDEGLKVTKFTWAGIRTVNAYLGLSRCKIDNNKNIFPQSYWNDGGGISLKNDNVELQGNGMSLDRCQITRNTANGNGGGIFFGANGGSNLSYTTISGNSAVRGGGIYIATNQGGYFHAKHLTVGANSATTSGGGIEEHHGGSLLEFDGSIIANNSAPTGANMIRTAPAGVSIDTIWGSGVSSTSLGCGAVANWTCTHNTFGANASFGPLMAMGGLLYWLEVLPLRKGSPAVDFNATASAESTDQRLLAAPQDGDNNGSSSHDAGAFEKNLIWQSEQELQWTNSANDLVEIDIFSGYSGGLGRRFQANGTSDWVNFTIPIVESGTYDITIRYKRTSNAGQFRVGTSTSPTSGFTWFTPNQNGYSTTTQMSSVISLGSRTFSAAGKIYVRFNPTAAGGQGGFNIYPDYIKVRKTN